MTTEQVSLAEQIAAVESRITDLRTVVATDLGDYRSEYECALSAMVAVLATLQQRERAMAALRNVEKILIEDTNALDHPCCGWGPTLAMVRAALDDTATPTAGKGDPNVK